MTQQQLANATGMNHAVLSRLESLNFISSITQLETLGDVLGFEPIDLFVNGYADTKKLMNQ